MVNLVKFIYEISLAIIMIKIEEIVRMEFNLSDVHMDQKVRKLSMFYPTISKNSKAKEKLIQDNPQVAFFLGQTFNDRELNEGLAKACGYTTFQEYIFTFHERARRLEGMLIETSYPLDGFTGSEAPERELNYRRSNQNDDAAKIYEK